MPSHKSITTANLVFFYEERWRPQIVGFHNDLYHFGEASNEGIGGVSLLESLLWLLLGVNVGYFPVRESHQVLSEFAKVLRKAYITAEKNELISQFPQTVQRSIEAIIGRTPPVFPALPRQIAPNADVQSMFQSFLLLSNSFVNNRPANAVTRLLVAADDGQWKQIAEVLESSQRQTLGARLEAVAGATISTCVTGFVKLVEYLETFQGEWLRCAKFQENLKRHGFHAPLNWIKTIQRWRFDFSKESVSIRFLVLRNFVITTLLDSFSLVMNAMSEQEQTVFVKNYLLKNMDFLTAQWEGAPVDAGTSLLLSSNQTSFFSN